MILREYVHLDSRKRTTGNKYFLNENQREIQTLNQSFNSFLLEHFALVTGREIAKNNIKISLKFFF